MHQHVAQAAPVALGAQALAVGAVADQQVGHVGLHGRRVEHRPEAMRQAVAADVGDDELLVESEACSRAGAASRPGANRRVSAPLGMTASLLRGTPRALEVSANAWVTTTTRAACAYRKCASRSSARTRWAPGRIRPELDDGFRPQVAHFEHERHALRRAP